MFIHDIIVSSAAILKMKKQSLWMRVDKEAALWSGALEKKKYLDETGEFSLKY